MGSSCILNVSRTVAQWKSRVCDRTHQLRRTDLEACVTSDVAEVLAKVVARQTQLVVAYRRHRERERREYQLLVIQRREAEARDNGGPA